MSISVRVIVSALACIQFFGCAAYPRMVTTDKYTAESFEFGNESTMVVAVAEKSQFIISRFFGIVKESLDKRQMSYSKPSPFNYSENSSLQLSQGRSTIFEFVLSKGDTLHFSVYCEKASDDGTLEPYVYFSTPVSLSGQSQELSTAVDNDLDEAFRRLRKWGVAP